jgi:hypothetical protein
MKNFNRSMFAIAMMILFHSCSTSWHYYQPTANPVLFKEAGEVHVSGEIGTSGASAKGGVSLTDNIAIVGQYNSGFTDYRSSEGEAGVGFYTSAAPRGTCISAGLGFGSNYEFTDSTQVAKDYEGSFLRPYGQFSWGVTGGTIFGGVKGDVVTMLKLNYFMYDGRRIGSNESMNSNYFTFEPSVAVGLGGRIVRFEMIYGFPIHISLDDRPKARTFPMNLSIGLHFVFGRSSGE